MQFSSLWFRRPACVFRGRRDACTTKNDHLILTPYQLTPHSLGSPMYILSLPPLVSQVKGTDCWAAGLASFQRVKGIDLSASREKLKEAYSKCLDSNPQGELPRNVFIRFLEERVVFSKMFLLPLRLRPRKRVSREIRPCHSHSPIRRNRRQCCLSHAGRIWRRSSTRWNAR